MTTSRCLIPHPLIFMCLKTLDLLMLSEGLSKCISRKMFFSTPKSLSNDKFKSFLEFITRLFIFSLKTILYKSNKQNCLTLCFA